MFDRALEQDLSSLGLSGPDQVIYEILVDRGPSLPKDLVKASGFKRPQVQASLTALAALGLVGRAEGSGKALAAPPRAALELLVLRRQEELERLRIAAARMQERFDAVVHEGAADDIIEIVRRDRRHRIKGTIHATSEVLCFDTPPYGDYVSDAGTVEPNPGEFEALQRGVRVRVLYDRAALEYPGQAAALERLADAGEKVRVVGQVPMTLFIVDRQVALMPLQEPFEGDWLVVRSPILVRALVALFEAFWARGTPIYAREGDVLPPEIADETNRRILDLMTAGLVDAAIARQLGVSHRTVTRRVDSLMRALDAGTRFQAGMMAERRRWIGR